MNILLSAYACEPNRGSEPGVGWQMLTVINPLCSRIFVLVDSRHENSIKNELKITSLDNVEFIFLKVGSIFEIFKHGFGRQAYYYLWQIKAYFIAKNLLKREKIDLIHHVTFVNDYLPSFLSLLKKPFIWGPVGGSNIKVPSSFYQYIGLKNSIKELLRSGMQFFFQTFDLFYKLTLKKSKRIIVANSASFEKIPLKYRTKTEIHSQIGINKIQSYKKRSNKKLKIVYGGLLLYWKGSRLALESFLKFKESYSEAELYFIGKGPEESLLKKIVSNSKFKEDIHFIQNLPQKEFFKQFETANIFLFPSFHDSGAMVIVEAMSFGVPIICLNAGGPADTVTKETGFKITPTNPQNTIKELSLALLNLANNDSLREKMGKAAIQRAKDFLWTKKQKWIKETYNQVLTEEKK